MTVWDNPFWFTSYILVFTALSAFGAHRIKVLYQFWKHRNNAPQPKYEFAELPVITIQLPIFNEYDVVENLLRCVSALDYPHDRLQIQVLDDSIDETAAFAEKLSAEYAAKGLDIEYRHRTNRHGFKAGALDEAMPFVKGEFICIFDADFQPQPDYLKKVIHHFTHENVGMVQARWGHANKDFSLLTRLQALFLDGHLVLEQTARSRHGEFLNFNGTAGIWRRKAIEDGGGWQHDTLTEDLDLSYRAQLKGWKFIYLKDVVVPAELPPDMDGFKSQQHRWTKGSIQVCKKILGDIWRSDIPLPLKLEATAHLTSNFAYLLTLCTLVLMYPANFVMGSSWHKAVFVDVPVFFFASFSVVVFYMTAQGAQTRFGWLKALPYVPVLLALGIGMSINNGKAVLEALLNQSSEFVRTPKYGVETKSQAAVKKSRYKAGKSIALWIEVALTGYFGWMIALAAQRGQWGSIPFLLLFFFGFGYVAAGSLMKRFSMERFQTAPVAAA
ncbi:cellulose synthase family protein [Prosthecobacter sp.]|uniref:cellulose synthase family protein n=1 Tax=Prosthecobacter sp. TaxID=1965333 RepID=UPI002ABD0DDE|nr:cellulose synthase family protein [Prosthecobacter sp.]MDZ4405259.1 cellulose synthase family protein [Prosthecobacter sp.]